jgi:hypothetical protein
VDLGALAKDQGQTPDKSTSTTLNAGRGAAGPAAGITPAPRQTPLPK